MKQAIICGSANAMVVIITDSDNECSYIQLENEITYFDQLTDFLF